jgi:aminoglycoside phosphotransferase (APT) family kinase protein
LRRDQLPDLPVVDGANLRSIITSALRVVHDQRLESEVSARLEDSLSIDALWTYPLAPVHGDLGLEHIIVDNGGEVSGIIDWSDVRMDDRAVDLAGIAKTAGLETAMMVASRLDENVRDDSWFVKRVALRADWAQLLAIVHQMRGLNLGSSR